MPQGSPPRLKRNIAALAIQQYVPANFKILLPRSGHRKTTASIVDSFGNCSCDAKSDKDFDHRRVELVARCVVKSASLCASFVCCACGGLSAH